MLRQWKKQMSPALFALFLQAYTRRSVALFKRELGVMDLSLLGALYFDKIARKFKNFVQFLSEKPLQSEAVNELIELAQVLSCENLDELDNILTEKTDLIVNKALNIEDVKQLVMQRVDLDKEALAALLRNFA